MRYSRRSPRLLIDKRFLCFESMRVTAENPFSTKYDVGNDRTHIIASFHRSGYLLATWHQNKSYRSFLKLNLDSSSLCKSIKNKLSLNRQKSHYMLINKRPSVSCIADLQLSINSHVLKRQQTVKYLGIFVDENLNWSTHIHQLSLQLARYSGLFYRLRKLVPPDVIRMLYHSLVQSKVQYGIAVW